MSPLESGPQQPETSPIETQDQELKTKEYANRTAGMIESEMSTEETGAREKTARLYQSRHLPRIATSIFAAAIAFGSLESHATGQPRTRQVTREGVRIAQQESNNSIDKRQQRSHAEYEQEVRNLKNQENELDTAYQRGEIQESYWKKKKDEIKQQLQKLSKRDKGNQRKLELTKKAIQTVDRMIKF